MTNPWNAVAGFPRWTPGADFTVGSQVSDYPGSNLGAVPLSYPWRSAGLSIAQTTLTATFARPRKLGLVVVGPHNLSIGSRLRVETFYGPLGVGPLWDSGEMPTWPAVFTADQVDWDGGRWWDRTYTPEEVQGYPWYRPVLVPAQDYALSVRVTLIDPLNPAGYVQAGLLELASALRLPVNFAPGAQYGYRGRTETQEADGGTKHRRRRPKPRVFKGSVPLMPRDDALGSWLEMQRQLDTAEPFFWWPRPTDERHMVRQAFMAHFTDLDLHSYATHNRNAVPISLEEEL